MNDDFFINSPINPSVFYTSDGRMRIYQQILTGSNYLKIVPWSRMISSTNKLLDNHFNETRKRHYISHVCYLFRLSVLKKLYNLFPKEKG